MRFETSQNMQLQQQMKLSPRMIQSMEILQMPMLALQERIEQELESNIALEQVEGDPRSDPDGPADRRDSGGDDGVSTQELVVNRDASSKEDFERLNAFESTYREAFDNQYSSSKYTRRTSGERDRKMDAMANVAARGETLAEQLRHQWSFAEVEDSLKPIGDRMIEYINDDGIFAIPLETILDNIRHNPDVSETLAAADDPVQLLERTTRELQFWLEPVGVAARSVDEALLLQVDDHAMHDEEESHDWNHVRTLIESHLDDLLQNRLPKIVQQSDLSMEQIQAAKQLMRRLNPAPGRDLVTEDVPPIIPDVVVEYDEQRDEYIAGLTNGLLPTLKINHKYADMSKDKSVDKNTRDFVNNNLRTATWLIESINQRHSTLLRVVNVVIARQRGFFDEGPAALRPLPMTEVADQLGIDVSTVSRAVADKWMQTPRGVFPLRRFFSGGATTDSGEDMSWEAIKVTLKEIIDAEDKTKPYSDEALSKQLKQRGIDIARRTVVKYRQQLDIPPARRRKQY